MSDDVELICGHFSSLLDVDETEDEPAFYVCLWCGPDGDYTAAPRDWDAGDANWDEEEDQ